MSSRLDESDDQNEAIRNVKIKITIKAIVFDSSGTNKRQSDPIAIDSDLRLITS
jgi:hypothetical protein